MATGLCRLTMDQLITLPTGFWARLFDFHQKSLSCKNPLRGGLSRPIYTKAFFQAWIKAQPSLSLSEFIDRFKAGDKTILEALDRERMTLPGHTLTPERHRVPRHVA
jgi:hypothetical protein